jgi:hypothetical protein
MQPILQKTILDCARKKLRITHIAQCGIHGKMQKAKCRMHFALNEVLY